MKKTLLILVVILSAISFKTNAQESIKSFIGNWDYECIDAPYEYSTGILIIKQKDNKPVVEVLYNDGTKIVAESVKIIKGILFFDIYVEDNPINIELKKVDANLSGKVLNGYNEELIITASKKK